MILTALRVASRQGVGLGLVRAYLVSGYLVIAIAAWQFIHNVAGLYYPEEFLYSNTSWVIFSGQVFGGVKRLNGPFTEPSSIASYMAGVTFSCFWLTLRGHRGWRVSTLFVSSALIILLSTSTTGIVALAVGLPAMLVVRGVQGSVPGLRRILIGGAGCLVLLLLGAVLLPSVAPRISHSISAVVQDTLYKDKSELYAIRSTMDAESLALGLKTHGLGAGWGSVRASSLLPNLVGNVGFVGVLLVIWCGATVGRIVARARRQVTAVEQVFIIDAAVGSLLGILTAALVAGPQIKSLSFYVLLGTLIGCAARISSETRANLSAIPGARSVRQGLAMPKRRAGGRGSVVR